MVYIRTSGPDGINAYNVAKKRWIQDRFVFTDRDESKWNTKINDEMVISHYQMYRDWKQSDVLVVPWKFYDKDLLNEIKCAGVLPEDIFVYFDGKLIKSEEYCYLDYLEFHVNDHCNLNCKGCSHFCPLVKKPSFANFEQVEKDLIRLKELICLIKRIRIMGGEPFLNKELVRYLDLTRKVFPYSDIRIVTNGILINSLKEDIWEGIRRNDVAIDISVYPPILKSLDNCIKTIEKNKCRVGGMQPVSKFEKILHTPSPFEMDNTNSCICNNIHDGYIASCPMVFYGKYYNEYFNETIPFESGKINLYEVSSGKELINKLNSPFELCDYCRNYMMGINTSEKSEMWDNYKNLKECKRDDWNI